MKRYLLLLLLIGCSSNSPNPTALSDPGEANPALEPSDGINAFQVAYPGLIQSDIEPQLAELLLTQRTSHWNCIFTAGQGILWQTVFYFFADGNGEALFSQGYDGFNVPDTFIFTWRANESLTLSTELGTLAHITMFDFKFETNSMLVLGSPSYEFTAKNSQSGETVCGKYGGEA